MTTPPLLQSPEPSLTWAASPARELVRLAWPVIVSLVSFSLMTAVDTAFVGRLGASALAAIGVGGMAVFCVLSFGVAVFAAAKVHVGHALGARDVARVEAQLGAFLRLAVVLGLFSCGIGCLVAQGLRFVHADPTAGDLSVEYATLRSFSLPLALVSSAIGQWRQAQGDSRTAMRAALVANAVNVPLNALFIFGLGWGTAGAAGATVLSRLVETSWLLAGQRREGLFWDRAGAREALGVLRTGLTTGLERVLDLSVFLVLAGILAQVGSVELAAHQIALQIAHFCFLPLIAISESVSVLVAQTRGAGVPALQQGVTRSAYRLVFSFSSVAALVLIWGRIPALQLFTSDAAVIESGARVVLWAALLQWLCAPYNVLKGLFRGLGEFTLVAFVAVGTAWLFSPPLTWLFSWRLGYGAAGAWAAICVEVSAGVALLLWRSKQSSKPAPKVAIAQGSEGLAAQKMLPLLPADPPIPAEPADHPFRG